VGQLDFFHNLAVVNNAAIYMGVQVLYCYLIYIPSGISLGLVLESHMVVIFLVFWETSTLFSIVDVLIYIPIKSAWRFLYSHILTNIFVVFLMILFSQEWCEILNWFDFHFLYGHLDFFCHLDFFLWNISVQFTYPFLYWVIGFVDSLFFISLHILIINPLSDV
jgi:hypothetical protein